MSKKNRYSCKSCEYQIVTVDTHEGTTPFAIPCDKCENDHMTSAFYAVDQTLEPTHEWYRPNMEQLSQIIKVEFKKFPPELIAKLKADKRNPEKVNFDNIMEHFNLGGLFLRKIEKM